MNNSDLKVQLIEQIINGDDTFLNRLNDFVNIDEERLEIVDELTVFNNDEWKSFIDNYSQFIRDLKDKRQRRELYDLISEEQKYISKCIDDKSKIVIEEILIIGNLSKNGNTPKEIIERMQLLNPAYDKSGDGPKNNVSRYIKIFDFIYKYDIAKEVLFTGVMNPSTLRNIIDNDKIKAEDIKKYLSDILKYYKYLKINEETGGYDFNIPTHKSSGYNKAISITEVENFNKQNP
jgi:hypothetical protein